VAPRGRLLMVLGFTITRGKIVGPEAADALEITPDVFRKRLQHARAAVLSFTRSYCGLVSDTAVLVPRRSSSHIVWRERSTRRVTDVSERRATPATSLLPRWDRSSLSLLRPDRDRVQRLPCAILSAPRQKGNDAQKRRPVL
jgi:hypothetical protein